MRTELLRLGTRCRYLSEEILIREGDRSSHVVLLRSGFAKVTAQLDNGHEALLAIRVSGDVVGEMAAMDEAPRSATVTACGEVVASVVRESDLRLFLRDHPEAALAIARIVSQRLRWANRRRVEFGGYPVKVRLARVLAELALSYGHPVPRGLVIGVDLTQPELAALTGSAEVTIHKALRELREEGLITTGYRRTTVLDLRRLREIARLAEALP
ncbi:Crp/Fnr family transcriptional regulator [Streptomyces scopuliridis]|uniref:Crp/Fnr family transcriptional regulator n=1 Tax=Streptomyces scopuliridis TaxID=452529 RepID=A0ACD4ZK18_9ACTN|nr:Crp/Fnr family transcriptional regulator [Streptomyces scopuliridis]WSB34592.1 Crp/Fnr family transcriptional regulator [Streptomyces scopuliridis]WSB98837.1 Crp/Fnr family transcriptional regulator [Streptomyces scopuliridis]WSC07459.1 Crp/Fnr family transcriptional regulator [Streptomyces scopuliridis]